MGEYAQEFTVQTTIQEVFVDSPPTSQVTRKQTVRPTVRQQQSRRVDIHSPRRQ
jgi:hypothetical protein